MGTLHTAIASLVLWAGTLAVLIGQYGRVRHSTLSGPWFWTCFAVLWCALAALVRTGLLPTAQDLVATIWHVAAVSTCCPIMAVFGAKRPQCHVWHFVVLSLWLVLILPMAEYYFAHNGLVPDLRGIRAAFVVILVLVGFGNYCATRFLLPTALVLLAQALLVAPTLVRTEVKPRGWGDLIAAFSVGGAVFLVMSRANRGVPESEWNSKWHDFRDYFGAVWSLRIAERLNTMGAKRGWPHRVGWNGIITDPQAVSEQTPDSGAEEFDRSLRMLLRLFEHRTTT